MTTDTEALRRAFEAFSLDGGLTPGDLEWNGRFYIVPFTQDEWLTFQAGHTAAHMDKANLELARQLVDAAADIDAFGAVREAA